MSPPYWPESSRSEYGCPCRQGDENHNHHVDRAEYDDNLGNLLERLGWVNPVECPPQEPDDNAGYDKPDYRLHNGTERNHVHHLLSCSALELLRLACSLMVLDGLD